MNGNSCKQMCDIAKEMMDVSKVICKEKLHQRHTRNETLQICSLTLEECHDIFKMH